MEKPEAKTTKTIKDVPGVFFVDKKGSSNCVICLERLENGVDHATTACGHTFHTSCVMNCVVNGNNDCPLCRKNMVEKKPEERPRLTEPLVRIFVQNEFNIMNLGGTLEDFCNALHPDSYNKWINSDPQQRLQLSGIIIDFIAKYGLRMGRHIHNWIEEGDERMNVPDEAPNESFAFPLWSFYNGHSTVVTDQPVNYIVNGNSPTSISDFDDMPPLEPLSPPYNPIINHEPILNMPMSVTNYEASATFIQKIWRGYSLRFSDEIKERRFRGVNRVPDVQVLHDERESILIHQAVVSDCETILADRLLTVSNISPVMVSMILNTIKLNNFTALTNYSPRELQHNLNFTPNQIVEPLQLFTHMDNALDLFNHIHNTDVHMLSREHLITSHNLQGNWFNSNGEYVHVDSDKCYFIMNRSIYYDTWTLHRAPGHIIHDLDIHETGRIQTPGWEIMQFRSKPNFIWWRNIDPLARNGGITLHCWCRIDTFPNGVQDTIDSLKLPSSIITQIILDEGEESRHYLIEFLDESNLEPGLRTRILDDPYLSDYDNLMNIDIEGIMWPIGGSGTHSLFTREEAENIFGEVMRHSVEMDDEITQEQFSPLEIID